MYNVKYIFFVYINIMKQFKLLSLLLFFLIVFSVVFLNGDVLATDHLIVLRGKVTNKTASSFTIDVGHNPATSYTVNLLGTTTYGKGFLVQLILEQR